MVHGLGPSYAAVQAQVRAQTGPGLRFLGCVGHALRGCGLPWLPWALSYHGAMALGMWSPLRSNRLMRQGVTVCCTWCLITGGRVLALVENRGGARGCRGVKS